MTRIALDASVLIPIEGFARTPADAPQIEKGRRLVRGIGREETRALIPLDALIELHDVLVRSARLDPREAATRISGWRRTSEVIAADAASLDLALEIAAEHALPIRDASILASAIGARCAILLSQVLPDGLALRGLTVSNPFGPMPDPRLAPLFD